jgi:hypothetical protein
MTGTDGKKQLDDLDSLGWAPEAGVDAKNRLTSFGVLRGQPVISPAQRAKAKQMSMLTNTKGLPQFNITDPKNVAGANQSIAATGNAPSGAAAQGLISAGQQASAETYLKSPGDFSKKAEEENKSAFDTTKDFLGNLFDSKDEEKEVFGEGVFDAALNGIGWFYDTINQAGSWAQSVAPGGLETFDWDSAKDISYGQAAVTANAKLVNEYGVLGAVWGAVSNPLGIGGIAGAQVDAEFAKKTFDIKDAEQRRKAFEEDTFGKFATGVPDTIFTVFADPLIFGGKALKISRIKYVDRQVVSKEQIDNLVKEIDTDVININTQKAVESTPGAFLEWVMKTDPATGKRVRSTTEIYEHPVVKNSPARDSMTYAFSAADDVEEAAAILKQAYGDIESRQFLMNRRQDIVGEIATASRAIVDARLRFDPKSAASVIKKAEKNSKKAHDNYLVAQREFDAGNLTDQNYVDELFKKFDDAEKNLDYVTNFQSRNPLIAPATAEEVRLAQETHAKLISRDRFLQKALDEEKKSAFRLSNKGFAVGNKFGMAVEQSRQARATAAAEAKATPMAPWKHDDFYDTGFGTRLTRVWRYASFERPSGFIQTRGAATADQGREIMALLSTVPIYKGAGVEKTLEGKVVTIGGTARREELFNRYLGSVGTGVDAENSISKTVDAIEKAIMNDIGKYHGLTKGEVKVLLKKAREERTASLKKIQEDKFWVEEVNGKTIYHKAPYIESQLQQGTYMINFDAFDKTVKEWVRKQNPVTRTRQKAENTLEATWEHTQNLYTGFNDLWRPAVLLRLGYTQRNVAEGLFRASAFLGSVAPLAYAGKQTGLSIRNVAVKRAHTRELARVEKAATAKGTSVAQAALAGSSRFKNWRTKQETILGQFIADKRAFIVDHKDQIAAGKLTGPEVEDALKSIEFIAKQADEAEARLLMLSTDDDAAFSYFRKQGASKRRMWDNVSNVDSIAHREAFSNPEYADIAWMNMSNDVTMKTTLSLQENASQNIFKALKSQYYTSVTPADGDAYFDGVSRMLGQFRNSEVGERILAGENPADIAKWLMTSPEGKEISRFVNGKVAVGRSVKGKKGKKAEKGFDTSGLDGALGYVNTLVDRLNTLAPSPDLRDALRLTDVSGADVKRMLDKPEYEAMLGPAIGNVAEEVGFKSLRDNYASAAAKLFKILGTIPEDNLVRGPFYGRRYKDYVDSTISLTRAQSPTGFISALEVDSIHRMAHRRALKDTKEWLYTLDRRTNLGHYGEAIFPFISATQNSVTALGKLTWRDPALPAMVAAVWNLPEKMDIEDEEGNIVFPVQLNFVPKSIRDSLGVGNILNAKFSKQGLNAIFPETGFMGFVPRMGPVAGIPVSEMMKNEWFGASLDTPSWLGFMGKDVADEIWSNWRDYVYGEDRGPSSETLSWNLVSPPFATKIVQMFQGMNSAAFAGTYNKIMQSENLKWQGGDRETPPDADELVRKTQNFFILRAIGNLVAFTPPQYEMTIDPLVTVRRSFDRLYGPEADAKFNDQFGNLMLMASNTSPTKNVAGILPTMEAVANAKKYDELVGSLAPNVQYNPGVLGIILNGDIEAEYDPSALTWQSTHKIPGLNRTYRELLNPAQVEVEAERTAGWVEFIKFMDQTQALLQQRGLNSLQSRGAEDLAENKKRFIEAAKNNPLYSGWYDDYINFGSTRVVDSVKTLEAALSNKEFMDDHVEDPIWNGAYQYVTVRKEVVEALAAASSSDERKMIRNEWATFRTSLINTNNKWGTIANRYLDGDDDPTAPSTQMFSVYDVYDQQSVGVIDPDTEVDESGFLKPTEFQKGQ